MKISIIVAMASNRAIGRDKEIPWHLSVDLKRFKQITINSPVLMGRKTYESIGRPLPGRTNIIISRNLGYKQKDCLVFNTIEKAIDACQKQGKEEVFIIGGASFYKAMLPKADTLFLTLIDKEFNGDTFFPRIDLQEWNEVAREDVNDDSSVDFNYSFLTLERKNSLGNTQ